MKPQQTLLNTFVELHPEDAARAFESLPPLEAVRMFKGLAVPVAVRLLERLTPQAAKPIAEQLQIAQVRDLLSRMEPRIASAIVHLLDTDRKEDILTGLDETTERLLRELVRYPEDTAGGIMDPRVASLSIDLTVQQAIARIRRTPREAVHYLYVTQRDRKLIGVMNMRDLLLASPRDPIEPLVRRDVLAVPDTMDREEVVGLMLERRFLALPVVDLDGRLVGVVKHGEALEATQLEAFEDLQKIVGAGADERALSPVSLVVRRRLPWLLVNLGTAFLAAAVVGMFEGIIARVAALAVLLPVVAGQGGNTGSQSVAVVMRGLALREILPGMRKRVILKELCGGLLNGCCVAVLTAACVYVWRVLEGEPQRACIGMSLVIGIAMIISMATAAASGAAIPLVLRALGRDPAQSASIFLTTITDVVGFASFLGFATLFSQMLV